MCKNHLSDQVISKNANREKKKGSFFGEKIKEKRKKKKGRGKSNNFWISFSLVIGNVISLFHLVITLRVRVVRLVLLDSFLDLVSDRLSLALLQPESRDSKDSLVEDNLSTTGTRVHQPDAEDVLDDEIRVETGGEEG